MSQNDEQEINQVANKLSNVSKDRTLQQFLFVLKYNQKYGIIEQEDIDTFNKKMRKIQITNITVFSGITGIIGGIYWKMGGFDHVKNAMKNKWLLRLRHAAVFSIPSLVMSPFIASFIENQSMEELSLIANKYKDQIQDHSFNRKLAKDLKKEYNEL